MIVVERTAPLLTVQDRGRFGYLAAGVTHSGPLDSLALAVANALVGNDEDAACLEGCLGGATFRCERDVTFAITGADVIATCGDAPVTMYAARTARAGDVITVERIERGAIWYIAFRGGVDAPLTLRSRSTLLSAGLGGFDGGTIRKGRSIALRDAARRPAHGTVAPNVLRAPLDVSEEIALCAAPRSDALTDADWNAFYSGTFTVSHSVSRVGYRLTGPVVSSTLPADLASEAACAGAMQLPPEGQPIVLMADHPTIGGYPYIGAVPAHALGRLAQRAPGSPVRFTPQSASDARNAYARVQDALLEWASRG